MARSLLGHGGPRSVASTAYLTPAAATAPSRGCTKTPKRVYGFDRSSCTEWSEIRTQDYVSASKATLAEMASVALQAARALWLPLAAVSALAAALIVGLVFVHNASGGSKIAGYVASAVVYVAAVWRTAGSRVASLARKLEEPLWGASIDSQLALAMTLPPAGTADPSGWVAFVDQARADEAKPKESRDAHNETKSRTQPHPGREPTRPTGTPSAEV